MPFTKGIFSGAPLKLQVLRRVSVSSQRPFPGWELFGGFCNQLAPPRMCPVWHVLTIYIKSTEAVFNLESGAKPRGAGGPGAVTQPLLTHCWRPRVTGARHLLCPRGGAGGAETLQALLPRTSSGGLVTLGNLEIPLWVHEAPCGAMWAAQV